MEMEETLFQDFVSFAYFYLRFTDCTFAVILSLFFL